MGLPRSEPGAQVPKPSQRKAERTIVGYKGPVPSPPAPNRGESQKVMGKRHGNPLVL